MDASTCRRQSPNRLPVRGASSQIRQLSRVLVSQSARRGSTEPIAWCSPRAGRFWGGESETFTVACLAQNGRSVGHRANLARPRGKDGPSRLVEFLKDHAQEEFLEHPTPG